MTSTRQLYDQRSRDDEIVKRLVDLNKSLGSPLVSIHLNVVKKMGRDNLKVNYDGS